MPGYGQFCPIAQAAEVLTGHHGAPEFLTSLRDPQTLTAVWVGDLGVADALGRGTIELEGPEHLRRSFPKWFGLHPLFAATEHPASRPRVGIR